MHEGKSQSVLNFKSPIFLPYETFIGQENVELLFHLENEDARMFYIWSKTDLGQSLLLESFVHAKNKRDTHNANHKSPAIYFNLANADELNELWNHDYRYYAIDKVDKWTEENQQAIFNLINRFRNEEGLLLFSSSISPSQLQIREDLRTRLAQSLVFELKALRDEELHELLTKLFEKEQMGAKSQVIEYILRYYTRDVSKLLALVEALKLYTLSHQRPLTRQFVQEYFKSQDKSFDLDE